MNDIMLESQNAGGLRRTIASNSRRTCAQILICRKETKQTTKKEEGNKKNRGLI